jgi:Tol biopolymer transport system component
VTGGSDVKGPGLFKVPVDGGAPFRLTSAFSSDPAWSPDGSLIVYAGPVSAGRTPFMAVRPDGSSVDLPELRGGAGRQHFRFLPDGNLVYVPAGTEDFFLLDLQSKKTRPIARMTARGEKRGFDITPDGKQIVFDRIRENSDIVLIDLPRR